jgi:hypothetical protein
MIPDDGNPPERTHYSRDNHNKRQINERFFPGTEECNGEQE